MSATTPVVPVLPAPPATVAPLATPGRRHAAHQQHQRHQHHLAHASRAARGVQVARAALPAVQASVARPQAARPGNSVRAASPAASTATPAATTANLVFYGNRNTTPLLGNQVEGQIAINPTNFKNLVVVSENDASNGQAVALSRTVDGGTHWAVTTLGGGQDGLDFATPRVDARAAFDPFGTCYVAYIVANRAGGVSVQVNLSPDGGQNFTRSVAATGGSVQSDNPALAVGPDATNPNRQVLWISYTDEQDGRVYVTHATITGLGQLGAFSAPTAVSTAAGSASSIAVDGNGGVAVAWEEDGGAGPSSLWMNGDADGTGMLAGFTSEHRVASTNVGVQYAIPAQPDRTIDAEPKLAFDPTASTFGGRLYLVYTDVISGGHNNTDIFLRSSDNQGATWSNPVRVNDDPTVRSQFLPAISVDPYTAYVGISWEDARGDRHNQMVKAYAAVSTDGGASFTANARLSAGTTNQAGANGTGSVALGDLDLGDSTGLVYYRRRLMGVFADNSNSNLDNPAGTGKSLDIFWGVALLS